MSNPAFFRNSDKSKTSYVLRGSERPTTLILAEGIAEAAFLEKWLSEIQADPTQVAVICFKGINKLSSELKLLTDYENFEYVKKVGFFLDAETLNAENRLQSITDILRKIGLLNKNQALAPGQELQAQERIFAAVVSPNNSDPGCIEDIVLQELESQDLGPVIQDLRQSVEKHLGCQPQSKTLVQAALGILKPGMCGTHRGFEGGYLDTQHEAYGIASNTFERLISS